MSKLRGKRPKSKPQRLKCFMYAQSGVGKTTAAIMMPRPYVIDTERGCTWYGETIEERGGAVFETIHLPEIIRELHTLATEDHDFQTVVIDPVTIPYQEAVTRYEKTLKDISFAKHYVAANKEMSTLTRLLTELDMNVVLTAHAKPEYGDDMSIKGQTFDAYKKMPYMFDLVFELMRSGDKKDQRRFAKVVKSRMPDKFKDQEVIPWEMGELEKHFGGKALRKKAEKLDIATDEQIEKFSELFAKLDDHDKAQLKLDKFDLSSLVALETARVVSGIDLMADYVTKYK